MRELELTPGFFFCTQIVIAHALYMHTKNYTKSLNVCVYVCIMQNMEHIYKIKKKKKKTFLDIQTSQSLKCIETPECPQTNDNFPEITCLPPGP